MHLTLTLETLRCNKSADPDQDELFCNIHTGEGIHRRPLGTVSLGNWTAGAERRVDAVLWDQDLAGLPFIEVTFKDSDVGEAPETEEESRYRAFTFEDPSGGESLFDTGERLGGFRITVGPGGMEYAPHRGTQDLGAAPSGGRAFRLPGSGGDYQIVVREQTR